MLLTMDVCMIAAQLAFEYAKKFLHKKRYKKFSTVFDPPQFFLKAMGNGYQLFILVLKFLTVVIRSQNVSHIKCQKKPCVTMCYTGHIQTFAYLFTNNTLNYHIYTHTQNWL